MSRRVFGSLLAVVALLAFREPAAGQTAPFTYELRFGGTVPVEGMADAEEGWAGDVGTGVSFGMGFAYTVVSYAAVSVGFSQHRFGCRPSGCGRGTDLVATGLDLGTRFILGSGRVVPLVRAGVLSYRIEGRAPDGDGESRAVDSHRNVGMEAGVALSVRLSPDIVLTPGVRYLRWTSDFGAVGELPVRSVVADIGFVLGF